MLEIQVREAAKKFQFEWIFSNLSFEVPAGGKIAITGGNGSGKSTLLRCLSGQIPLTAGKVTYLIDKKPVEEAAIYRFLAIGAPYLELPEEYTLTELLRFHFRFKKKVAGLDTDDMVKIMYLEKSVDKQILYFSSGMKQRLKLGLCFFSDVPLLLLDEPVSNLDKKGIGWYQELVREYGAKKTVFVCSNDSREYGFCDRIINVEDYKPKASIS